MTRSTSLRIAVCAAVTALSLMLAPARPAPVQAQGAPAMSRAMVELNAPASARHAVNARLRDEVLATLPASEYSQEHRFEALPGFTITASDAALQQLAADPRVKSVRLDVPLRFELAESVRLIRADDVQDSLGLTGAGITVAIIDSGIDTDHPDLVSSLAFQECYAVDGCPGGGAHTSGPGSAEDPNGHGTWVSGIIASDGLVSPRGVAPGVSLGVYRIQSTIATVFLSDVVNSLDHIIANHPEVRAVSLSVSDAVNHGMSCDALYPLLTTAINTLRTNGVPTFIASGNDGFTNGFPLPACVSNGVSVGGVWDASQTFSAGIGCSETPVADRPMCFSDSASTLDLLAPGGFTTTDTPGGGTFTNYGTSFASPHATGAAALLLDLDGALTATQIETTLETTGVLRTDPKNGIITPRINVWAAAASLIGDPDGDALSGAADNCPFAFNPSQANNDRNFTDLTPPKANDDLTAIRSDLTGDACDPDDDNDGLSDTAETSGPPCASATLPTDPLLRDTDGDRFLDGAECALGYDPASPNTIPPVVGTDADADGVPDAFDPNDANVDSDGDAIRDGVEFRRFNSSMSSQNTDADACGDAREVASMDGNTTVNAADLGLTASAFGSYGTPPTPGNEWRVNMDADRNGTVNAADLGFVAGRFGACP